MAGMTDRLEAMLAAGRDNLLLRYTLGKNYVEAERFQEALAHLQAALVFDPAYSVAWKYLGKAYLGMGDRINARKSWEQGLDVALGRGDIQLSKELKVFIKRLDKAESGVHSSADAGPKNS